VIHQIFNVRSLSTATVKRSCHNSVGEIAPGENPTLAEKVCELAQISGRESAVRTDDLGRPARTNKGASANRGDPRGCAGIEPLPAFVA
jgi:hypothetical protein